ncbi:hypothetical protein [Nocardiopsis synnemataformans]|uniref:hypothetical protein n=1 Tax=Nocardiopsis synnemataformans TaxID=61305 RepID=UPI003EBEAC03
MKLTKKGKLIIFTPLFLLFAQACSPENEGNEAAPEEETFVNMERMTLVANVATFERMMKEGDPDDIFSSAANEESEGVLLNTGVISTDGGNYRVETDITEWNVTSGPVTAETSMTAVESSLGDILNHNNVTWCGTSIRGDKFVMDYFDRYEDSFATREEYVASIEDYVDCGTGEL